MEASNIIKSIPRVTLCEPSEFKGSFTKIVLAQSCGGCSSRLASGPLGGGEELETSLE